MAILLRIEQWVTTDDRSTLRRTIAPAVHINVVLAERYGGHIVLVTALKGDAFVEIALHADASEYDPASNGHLLREGECQMWTIWAGKAMIKECKKGSLRT